MILFYFCSNVPEALRWRSSAQRINEFMLVPPVFMWCRWKNCFNGATDSGSTKSTLRGTNLLVNCALHGFPHVVGSTPFTSPLPVLLLLLLLLPAPLLGDRAAVASCLRRKIESWIKKWLWWEGSNVAWAQNVRAGYWELTETTAQLTCRNVSEKAEADDIGVPKSR